MKLKHLLFLTLLAFVPALGQTQNLDLAAHGETAFVPGEIMVQIPNLRSADHMLEDLSMLGGTPTKLEVDRLVSKPMKIYLLTFDQDAVSPFEMLKAVDAHPAVSIAQFNHYVEQRETAPNDPDLGEQWHHINTGQGGGTPDADIDSDEAWDITTGGTTALGDEIVVCVIEGGNLNHPDLEGNAWVNTQEIPDNGIDDDGNGYTDDYLGWNVSSNDDGGVLQGGHGTQVMGMIGAKGDNDLGVVGANWDVKIMSVAGENLGSEASVVAAYTYPMTMRQIHTQTNGASGAFVVATNASWGIDGANPDNYPIWCAVYDTLGVYGILNCGATANNNVNIDNVGDMPTACSSPYMISVTATDNEDVRTFSAYGIESVDVGAPGDNVYTTSGSSGYGFTSGTSFASPLTAGVIGLLYSAPCASLIQIAKANPQMGADMVLEALYEGVDIVPNLINEIATGGRINANNSLLYILENCSEAGCITPFSLTGVQEAGTTNYTLTWNGLDAITYDLRYRIVGDIDWTEVNGLTDGEYLAADLQYCTDYEFQVRSNCEEESSEYSESFVWTTDGCCENPMLTVSDITPTTATVSWNSVLAAQAFNIRYRFLGSAVWTEVNDITETNIALDGLLECSSYEFQIQTLCIGDVQQDFSESTVFSTSGCGACQDLDYCASGGENASEEWIASVEFDPFENVSGQNAGYADFTEESHLMVQGTTQEFTLTPGFDGQSYDERFRIWIDYDQNGEFGETELVYDSGGGSPDAVSGSFTVSEEALIGSTRMRIAMKYVGGFFGEAPPPEACEVFDYGETEDYCVFIDEVSSTGPELDNALSVFPNPASSEVVIELSNFNSTGQQLEFQVLDMTGRTVISDALNSNRKVLDINGLSEGVYTLNLYRAGVRVASEQIVKTR